MQLDTKIPEGKRVRVPHKCPAEPFRKRSYNFRQMPIQTIRDKVERAGYGGKWKSRIICEIM